MGYYADMDNLNLVIDAYLSGYLSGHEKFDIYEDVDKDHLKHMCLGFLFLHFAKHRLDYTYTDVVYAVRDKVDRIKVG